MQKNKTKILSAAVVAAVLLTGLAVARTVHTPTASGTHADAAHGKVIGTNPAQAQGSQQGSHLHGIITCGPAANPQDCDKLETLLPMHWSHPVSVAKPIGI